MRQDLSTWSWKGEDISISWALATLAMQQLAMVTTHYTPAISPEISLSSDLVMFFTYKLPIDCALHKNFK